MTTKLQFNFCVSPPITELKGGFDFVLNDSILFQLFIHGSDLTNLFAQFPREMFPIEYGGSAGSIQKMHGTFSKQTFRIIFVLVKTMNKTSSIIRSHIK